MGLVYITSSRRFYWNLLLHKWKQEGQSQQPKGAAVDVNRSGIWEIRSLCPLPSSRTGPAPLLKYFFFIDYIRVKSVI